MNAEAQMNDFIYFECPECGFSSVQREDFGGSPTCSLCAGDSGHDVRMGCRVATDADKPEGFDARLGTRAEQTKKRRGRVAVCSTDAQTTWGGDD